MVVQAHGLGTVSHRLAIDVLAGHVRDADGGAFACGDADQQKVEYIAQRVDGGFVVITSFYKQPDREPF